MGAAPVAQFLKGGQAAWLTPDYPAPKDSAGWSLAE
jgi:hypothetical protein